MKDMKQMMEMLSKKDESKEMSQEDIQAKMDVLQELLEFASKHAGDDIVGKLKKVTVAAPSEQGLKEGLVKAKDMVEDMPEEDEMSPMDMMMADKEDEESEEEEEDETY